MVTFIGDIATYDGFIPMVGMENEPKNVIAVLEGPIVHNSDFQNILFNKDVIKKLKDIGVTAVSLANNHITDIPNGIEQTIENLSKNDIGYFGVNNGPSKNKPFSFTCEDTPVVIEGFGWEQISCKVSISNKYGINPLIHDYILNSVSEIRQSMPCARIVLFMHWDYELEIYPMPMHRQIAFDAIDAGVDLIVGSHPHCVQGIEYYKNKPVIYSLGNWYISRFCFYKGKLNYPSFSNDRFAIEWNPKNNDINILHLKYTGNNEELMFCGKIDLESDFLKRLTPFSGMDQKEYIKWFKVNRRQKKLLPVYANVNSKLNGLSNKWISFRGIILLLLFKLKIRLNKQKKAG